MTGASGAIYALRLLEFLCTSEEFFVHLVISRYGRMVLKEELGSGSLHLPREKVREYKNDDVGAAIASGSFPVESMVVIPCSMGTLAAIATGLSMNLIQRSADVTLKQGRKLILVPRETPLNSIHLSNMLKLSRAGVMIVPAMPGFYNQPQTIDDLVNFMVCRVLDLMGIENTLAKRWKTDG